MTKTFNLP